MAEAGPSTSQECSRSEVVLARLFAEITDEFDDRDKTYKLCIVQFSCSGIKKDQRYLCRVHLVVKGGTSDTIGSELGPLPPHLVKGFIRLVCHNESQIARRWLRFINGEVEFSETLVPVAQELREGWDPKATRVFREFHERCFISKVSEGEVKARFLAIETADIRFYGGEEAYNLDEDYFGKKKYQTEAS